MSYSRLGAKVGTVPKACKIDPHTVEWMAKNNLVANRTINYALQAYERAVQTDKLKPTWRTQNGSRAMRWGHEKLKPVAARIRRDLLEYLTLNDMNVNGTINEALDQLQTDVTAYEIQHCKPAPWLAQLKKK